MPFTGTPVPPRTKLLSHTRRIKGSSWSSAFNTNYIFWFCRPPLWLCRQNTVLLLTHKRLLMHPGQPIFVSSNCLPVKALKFEPAGHAYHSAALKLLGVVEDKEGEADDKKVADEKESSYLPSFDSYSGKSKKKSGSGDKQKDHYALLGLSPLRYLATEDQIRKSYREIVLKLHPDKKAARIP